MNKIHIPSLKKTISIFTAFILFFSLASSSFIAFAEEQEPSAEMTEGQETLENNNENSEKPGKKKHIQFKLKNQSISEEKKQKLLQKLEKIEEKIKQKEEKRKAKQLFKEFKKEQKKIFKENFKGKKLNKAERKELRKQFKQQLKSLKDINKELDDGLEDELKIELNDEEREMIEYIEPNYITSVQAIVPNDTDYEKQWGLTKIQAPEAWETSVGDPGVVIAVLDTGMDFNHVDKPVHIATGYDFINNDSDPQDDHGHGTFVSGLIAANTNNNVGVSGVCWDCTIMPVKVIDGDGLGTYEDLVNGIKYAVDNGANVINMSLGGYNYSQSLLEAINYAHGKGVVIVAASGNDGSNTPIYPAAYPNVIGVSATDENDERWEGSNYGEYIDISAPGVNLYGLSLDGGYISLTGTSTSTALISGAAGLLVSHDANLDADYFTKNTF